MTGPGCGFQRMEAQYALYKSGILDEEVWQLRRSYARAILKIPIFNASWEMDKKNSTFTEGFIQSVDSAPNTEISGFMGIGSIASQP